MSFFDAPLPATDASVADAPALDASMPVTDEKRRVRATSEEEDEPEKVLEGVEEEKEELITLEFEGYVGEVVEAYAKRAHALLAVTKP